MLQNEISFHEKIQSNRTTLLFVVLILVFAALAFWRMNSRSLDSLCILLFVFAGFFLFYTINYRTLSISINSEKVLLKFGVFKWMIPMNNIAACELDNNLPAGKEYGGAGIHFFVAHQRYRISFNFLEYDRVVLRLKSPRGAVKDVSFTTRKADEVLQIIQAQIH